MQINAIETGQVNIMIYVSNRVFGQLWKGCFSCGNVFARLVPRPTDKCNISSWNKYLTTFLL